MANRFLNNIRINDSYTLPAADGTENQVITTDGAGQLSFVDQSTVASGSSRTVSILVKNISSADGGVNLSKGDPVYIYGSVGASERLYVDLADAGDSSKMPCVALLDQNLSPNGEGTATVTGKLKNLITSPIDGATPTENDTLYVKSGGGLTLTKPTGPSNLIQNVGQVGRVSTSSDGNIVVSAILRSNDVPNLPTGRIWVGDGNTVVSDVVYLDETNERMGIGTASPSEALHVVGTGVFTGDIGVGTTSILGGAANRGNITVNGSSDAALAFGNGGTLKGFILQDSSGMTAYSDDAIYFYAGGSERMRINSLGDTSVFGDLGIYTTHGTFHFGSVAGANDLNSETALSAPEDLRISADNHIFRRDTAEHMRITSAGNVGIGTTSPTSQLSNTSVNSTDQAGIGHSSTAVAWRSNNQGYTATFDNYLDSTISNGLLVKTANTGTASYISKFESGGINRMAIRSDGNVGIGTDSPAAKLDLNGASILRGLVNITTSGEILRLNDTNSSGNPYMSFYQNGTRRSFIQHADTGDFLKLASEYGGISFFTGTAGTETQKMTILSGGNVGIGTTSPNAKLEVEQSNSGTNTIFLSDSFNNKGFRTGHAGYATFSGYQDGNNTTSGTAYGALIGLNTFYNGTNFYNDNQYVDPSSILFRDGTIRFHTNDISATGNFTPSERVRITKNGEVGINTTSPQYQLDVVGGWNDGIRISGEGTNNPWMDIKILNYVSESQAASFSDGSHIYTTNPSGGTTWPFTEYGALVIEARDNGNGGIAFRTGNAAGQVARMVIRETGEVGIGTTDPAHKLTISADNNTTALGIDFPSATFDFSANSSSGYVTLFHMDDTGLDIGHNSIYRALNLKTGNSDRLTILGDGNVGIGTTSPGQKLTVSGGNIEIADNTAGRKIGFVVSDSMNFNGTTIAHYGMSNAGNAEAGGITYSGYFGQRFFTNGQQRMVINRSGNVGIGTDSPAKKLVVAGSSSELQLYSDSDISTIDSRALGNTGNKWLSINPSGGNVGIGTDSPQEKLHVYNGSAYITPIAYAANQNDWVIKTGAYNNTGFDQGLKIKSSSGGVSYMAFETTGSIETMVLRSGNVGIGTDSPGQKLEVAGNIYAKSSNYVEIGVDQTDSASIRMGISSGGVNTFIDASNTGAGHAAGTPNIRLLFNTSEKFRFTGAGNFGIRTTNPQTGLHLSSTTDNRTVGGADSSVIRLTNTYASNFGAGGELQFGVSETAAGRDALSLIKGSYTAYSSGNYGGDLEFHTRNADGLGLQQRMTITAGGNVGIGTTSPGSPLHVAASGLDTSAGALGVHIGVHSSTYAGIEMVSAGSNSGWIDFLNVTGGGDYKERIRGGSGYFEFHTNSGERMRIDSSGKVGIGTTSPNRTFTVASNDFNIAEFSRNTAGGGASIVLQDGNDGEYELINGVSYFGIRSNFTDTQFYITRATGNVGIGTTSPAYQLQLSLNSAAKPTSSSWTVVSDERVKTNIQDYTTGLTEILQINPKTFDYNGKAGFDTTTGNIGIIAQDVISIMPETINTYNAKLNEDDTEDTELFNFDSHPVQFALINAIKELNSKIEALEARIQILENQ